MSQAKNESETKKKFGSQIWFLQFSAKTDLAAKFFGLVMIFMNSTSGTCQNHFWLPSSQTWQPKVVLAGISQLENARRH
jgi:hypothetical protein